MFQLYQVNLLLIFHYPNTFSKSTIKTLKQRLWALSLALLLSLSRVLPVGSFFANYEVGRNNELKKKLWLQKVFHQKIFVAPVILFLKYEVPKINCDNFDFDQLFFGIRYESVETIFWTYFSPMFHFYTPWKRQKTFGFLTFSGSIEMSHCTKMV